MIASALLPVPRTTLTREVAERLRQAILSGELVAGQTLTEAAMAGRLDVSRVPVREALVGIKSTLPEAVVLDISLPDGSGVEVLQFIRQHDLKLSVVVLTSNPYDPLRNKCQSLGAAAVLDKLEGLDQVRGALLALSPLSSLH